MKEQHQEAFLDIASVQTIIGKQFFYVNALGFGTIKTPHYHQAIDKYCATSGANETQIPQEQIH